MTPKRKRGKGGIALPAALTTVLLALVAVEALFAPHYKPVFPWHSLPGYNAIIGLLGSLFLVTAAKAAGKRFLQRPAGDETPRTAEDDDDGI